MLPYLFAVLLAVLPVLPLWMRSAFRRSAHAGRVVQIWLVLGYYFCMAVAIFLSFFVTWYSYSLTYSYLGTYTTGIYPSAAFWDEPLTPRGALYLLFVVAVPFFVFFRVGLVSVRDSHQVCKDQLTRVKKHFELGSFWHPFS